MTARPTPPPPLTPVGMMPSSIMPTGIMRWMRRQKNPYHYGTPAEGEHFVGRQEELAALLSRLRNGINVALDLAPPLRQDLAPVASGAGTGRRRGAVRSMSTCSAAGTRRPWPASWPETPSGRRAGAGTGPARPSPTSWRRIRARPTVTFDGDQVKFAYESRAGAVRHRRHHRRRLRRWSPSWRRNARRRSCSTSSRPSSISAITFPGLFKSLADAHPNVARWWRGRRNI